MAELKNEIKHRKTPNFLKVTEIISVFFSIFSVLRYCILFEEINISMVSDSAKYDYPPILNRDFEIFKTSIS